MKPAGLVLLVLFAVPVAAHAVEAQAPDPRLKAMLMKAVADSTSFKDRFDAEVWLMDMSHRLAHKLPDPQKRLRLLRLVHEEATRAKLPPELVLAVIDVESDFNRFAVSNAGAQGLMQVMPFWLNEIGRPNDNLFHIKTNLRMGCTILHYYMRAEHGDIRKALERYNGTKRRRYSDKVLTALSEKWYRE